MSAAPTSHRDTDARAHPSQSQVEPWLRLGLVVPVLLLRFEMSLTR